MATEPNLFIQTAFLGDLCLSVPALKRIKRLHPERPLWLVARKGFGEIFHELQVVDRVFEVEKGSRESYSLVRQELKKNQFHWIFSPHESFTSARLIWGLKSKDKIGFHKKWNFLFFSDRVEKNKALPEVFRQMSLLSPVDAETRDKLSLVRPIDWISPSDRLRAPPHWAISEVRTIPPSKHFFQKPMISLFPGSVWATKRWTLDGFKNLAKRLSDEGYDLALMGSHQEKDICEEIMKAVPTAKNFAGHLSLMETLSLLRISKLVISNDSGGSHLASLSNTPTLTIFGPTVLSQGFRPWVDRGGAVSVEGLFCRPCGAHGHQQCPLGTHECMKALGVDEVYSKVKLLL